MTQGCSVMCIRDQPFFILLMEQNYIPLSAAKLGNVWMEGVKF